MKKSEEWRCYVVYVWVVLVKGRKWWIAFMVETRNFAMHMICSNSGLGWTHILFFRINRMIPRVYRSSIVNDMSSALSSIIGLSDRRIVVFKYWTLGEFCKFLVPSPRYPDRECPPPIRDPGFPGIWFVCIYVETVRHSKGVVFGIWDLGCCHNMWMYNGRAICRVAHLFSDQEKRRNILSGM